MCLNFRMNLIPCFEMYLFIMSNFVILLKKIMIYMSKIYFTSMGPVGLFWEYNTGTVSS